jgi:TPR repeat protein
MYYNGIGVPVDKVRGVAWLGIAAEAHDDVPVRALEIAYASLTAAEKQQAGQVWKQLDEKYGDGAALPRALQNYEVETRMATGSHLGFIGNLQVYETGVNGSALGESGFTYYRRQGKDRDALIDQITGHVTVGKVQALKVSPEALQNASQTELTPPPAAKQ